MAEMARDKQWLDRTAILLSGLCLVHCLATAVLLTLVASAGSLLLDPRIHEFGLGLAILLAATGLGSGLRVHRTLWPVLIGAAGLATMALALMVPHGVPEIACTIAGVALVALAHMINRRALLR